jgi:DNA-binding MarR family transcriptional regulator
MEGHARSRRALSPRECRDAPAGDAAASVMNALRRIVSGLRAAEKQAKTAFGITPAQLFVLREIAKAETLSVGELAIQTATAQSSASEVVAHLETRGLASRSRSSVDARRTDITLTDEGRAILARATDTIQERLLSAFARLPESAQHNTAKLLGAWLDEAGLGGAEAAMFFEP